MSHLENHFKKFRPYIIGNEFTYKINHSDKKIVYADWTASGRLYAPIEHFISNTLGPFVANTHTETTLTGCTMTHAYHEAQKVIKQHVNANENDALICAGAGMTTVVNKLQRILGLRILEQYKHLFQPEKKDKPLVIVSHMEHYSNQTTWAECCADLRLLNRDENGLPDLKHLRQILERNKDRQLIIGSFTAASNVTGIITPIHEMAEIIHEYGGFCFADYAASAPYVRINMHPENPAQKLDAIFFSPHKFLGGPGSSGILIFDKILYKNQIPDHPGGGTILSMDPFGTHKFLEDIETREDGGTPGFLQTIKAALAIKLKDEMGSENILAREHELMALFLAEIEKDSRIEILERHQLNRLSILSFYVAGKHPNLIVKLLNDRFGVQTRGGFSCAGSYGHILLKKDKNAGMEIGCQMESSETDDNFGWVRVSLHPTMSNDDVQFIASSIREVVDNYEIWAKDYEFEAKSAEFYNKTESTTFIDLHSFRPIAVD